MEQALVRDHMEHLQQVITQSVKPFMEKIPQIQNRHKELLKGFLKERHVIKERVKNEAGLGVVERKLQDDRKKLKADHTNLELQLAAD